MQRNNYIFIKPSERNIKEYHFCYLRLRSDVCILVNGTQSDTKVFRKLIKRSICVFFISLHLNNIKIIPLQLKEFKDSTGYFHFGPATDFGWEIKDKNLTIINSFVKVHVHGDKKCNYATANGHLLFMENIYKPAILVRNKLLNSERIKKRMRGEPRKIQELFLRNKKPKCFYHATPPNGKNTLSGYLLQMYQ